MANFCEVVAQRLAWDQAPRWGKKAKKGVKQQKIKIILKKKKTASEANRAVDWGGERATARLAFYFRSFPPKCAKWSKACQRSVKMEGISLALCGFCSNPPFRHCIFTIIMLNDGQSTRIPS